MPTSLVERLLKTQGYLQVDSTNLADFLASAHEAVLFFTEDPQRFPESNDVAAILPEIIRHYQPRLTAAVVSRAAQKELQLRFNFSQWPSLVFIRDGVRLGVISRVQSWGDYIAQIDELLARPTREQIPLRHIDSLAQGGPL
ncbi:hypothetical protein [Shewanella sp. GXUN23E]|uniref:hypothetical protein n=1 Tax=Shewanella sp. GXUN23E TaxID=3422498 RepID=UPI003D7C8CBF